jgi:cytochrome c-type biogenesis protein CcmH/NrfG
VSRSNLFAALLMGFLLVLGIGAATSYFGSFARVSGSEEVSFSLSRSGSDSEMLAHLKDYTRSIGTEEAAAAASGKMLPDVSTMIERLAARLEAAPGDINGWRMLGWSYFNTGHYEQATTAYAKAVELDPGSAELKRSYEEAKAKASGLDLEKTAKSEAMAPPERDDAIRSMVDRLAQRLESSPRDVDGWTRLMRSRVVLGEREVAVTAFRTALEVFKDDAAAAGKITAAATELGLNAER